jgi:hypothetical protein
MKNLKEILSIAILMMCAIMVVATWDIPGNAGWVIALVGWLEVAVYQRKKDLDRDLS